MHRSSLAARAGRWSAEHRKAAIGGWLAFVITAVVIGMGLVGQNTPESNSSRVGDSGTALELYDDAYPDKAGESVLIQSRTAGYTDFKFRTAVDDVIATVSRNQHVRDVRSPYVKANRGQVSADGRSVLVQFDIVGDEKQTEDRVVAVQDAIDGAAARHPQVSVGQFGEASAMKALMQSFQDDFEKAGQLSLPITLLILILAFGSLVAAGVPVLLGLTAVAGTLGVLGPVSQLIPLDEMIGSIVLLIGMAVGVDYALFYIRREREEKAKGADSHDAIEIAAATSGRAILVSGFTVMTAMAGMLFAGDRTFVALGIGAIFVVAVAMVGSVTVVPALLSKLGDRVDTKVLRWALRKVRLGRVEARIPQLLGRGAAAAQGGRGWSWILDRVLRRPLVSATLAAGLLVALAIPALSMHTSSTGVDDLPRKLEVMQVYDRMQAAFPGGQIPAVVVLKADDVTAPQVQQAAAQLRERALASGLVREPIEVNVSPDRRLLDLQLPIVGDGTDDESYRALARVRDKLVPDFENAAGAQAYVAGMTAESQDWNDLMKSRAPLVFAFVLTLAFILLLVTVRSIVIPIKAIVMNLLSVGAAYGVLKLVFQDGRFESLLGYESMGAITSWLPIFLFVMLFGLSMDYHVFILSRIREAYDSGRSTEDAVSHGIKATAGVVTSAAFVMVAVFAIFATLSNLDFKMMGVGLATAILLDATIVRAVLLPATMKLLGDWNWYLPKRLEWLPRVGAHEPSVQPSRA